MDLLVFAPAIEAYDAGSQVLIISKNRKGDPHAVLARGGINAALGTMDPNDNWLVHAADTLREGDFIADYEKVGVMQECTKRYRRVSSINGSSSSQKDQNYR